MGLHKDQDSISNLCQSDRDIEAVISVRGTVLKIIDALIHNSVDERVSTGVCAAILQDVGSLKAESVDSSLVVQVFEMFPDLVQDISGARYASAAVRATGMEAFANFDSKIGAVRYAFIAGHG